MNAKCASRTLVRVGVLLVVLSMAVACQTGPAPAPMTPTPVRLPATAAPTLAPTSQPSSLDSPLPTSMPSPLDSPLMTPKENSADLADIHEVEPVYFDSVPVEIFVRARGTFPNACTGVDTIHQEFADDLFEITITVRRISSDDCGVEPVDFEESIPLNVFGLPAGVYRVNVNGVEAAFELEQDNTGSEEPDSRAGTEYGVAQINQMEVEVLPGSPQQLQVTVTGEVPDSCTTIGDPTMVFEDHVLVVTLPTARPARAACATVMTFFEKTLVLDLDDLAPGTYLVDVNGVQKEFVID